MLSLIKTTAILVLLSLLACHFANAQSGRSGCPSCDAVLQKDQVNAYTNVLQYINYFESINQVNYEERKHNAGLGISVPIPIVGEIFGMLTGSANYNDFERKYSEFKKDVRYQSLFSSTTQYSTSITSKAAVNAWRDCILGQTCDGVPFKGYIVEDNANTVTYSLRYQKYTGMPNAITVISSVQCNGEEILPPGERKINLATGVTNYNVVVPKKYKNDTASILITCTPVGRSVQDRPYSNFTYSSTFFNPVVNVSYVALEYTRIDTGLFTAWTPLSDNLDHVDAFECILKKKGNPFTCDKKWCANYMVATLEAPSGYVFYDMSNLRSYRLRAFNGDGSEGGHNTPASWNMDMVGSWIAGRGSCAWPAMAVDRISENSIKISILTGSGRTKWEVAKSALKISNNIEYPLFKYADYKTVTFNVAAEKIYDAPSKMFKKFKVKIYAWDSPGFLELNEKNIEQFIVGPMNGSIKIAVDLKKIFDNKTMFQAY